MKQELQMIRHQVLMRQTANQRIMVHLKMEQIHQFNDVIDTDTQGDKRIDYQQLYAQIVYEIEHGEEYAFTGDREQQIIAQNSDYYETPNVVSLFEDHFRKPEAGDEVLLMSPTEIVVALKLNPENHSNVTLLGLYLRRKGFLHGEGRQRRCYQVAVNTK